MVHLRYNTLFAQYVRYDMANAIPTGQLWGSFILLLHCFAYLSHAYGTIFIAACMYGTLHCCMRLLCNFSRHQLNIAKRLVNRVLQNNYKTMSHHDQARLTHILFNLPYFIELFEIMNLPNECCVQHVFHSSHRIFDCLDCKCVSITIHQTNGRNRTDITVRLAGTWQ